MPIFCIHIPKKADLKFYEKQLTKVRIFKRKVLITVLLP